MNNRTGPNTTMDNRTGPNTTMDNRTGPNTTMDNRTGPNTTMNNRTGPNTTMDNRSGRAQSVDYDAVRLPNVPLSTHTTHCVVQSLNHNEDDDDQVNVKWATVSNRLPNMELDTNKVSEDDMDLSLSLQLPRQRRAPSIEVTSVDETEHYLQTAAHFHAEDEEEDELNLMGSRLSIGEHTDRDGSISQLSSSMESRLHHIRGEISRRASSIAHYMKRPPTPDTQSLASQMDEAGHDQQEERRRSLNALIGASTPVSLPSMVDLNEPTNNNANHNGVQGKFRFLQRMPKKIGAPRWLTRSIDPEKNGYICWMVCVACAFIYNLFCIPLRICYPYQTSANLYYWMMADYLCDCIYLCDLLFVQPRIRFLRAGLTIKNHSECRYHYLRSVHFKYDALSLLPLDVLFIFWGVRPSLRLTRFLKFSVYFELFDVMESISHFPVAIRLTRIICYMMYMIHVNSGLFYVISAQQMFGSIPYDYYNGTWIRNDWVYNNKGNAYLRCFYLATKMAIKIGGSSPEPTNVIEFYYMGISWMAGVLVFAMLFGQVSDIITNAGKSAEHFRKSMDDALAYCQIMKVPKPVLRKVRMWYLYTWNTQKTLDEYRTISKLPLKLQTDLALSVHYDTLGKVQLFQDCEQAFLRDLVLKLKPILFLPGDFVCEKGEVGKEMYIISKGMLEVVGGDNNEKVFATLKAGTVFGEISLLSVGGGNRRTANVRSKGFTNLFVLSKDDLYEALEDYPQAKKVLKKKAKQMLTKDGVKGSKHSMGNKDEEIVQAAKIHAKEETPLLAEAVVKLLRPNSKTRAALRTPHEGTDSRAASPRTCNDKRDSLKPN